MLRFVADENFNFHIIKALRQRLGHVDLITIQAIGLDSAPDPDVLEFAASENRVVLSHDVNTLPKFAHERIARGERMPGVFIVFDGPMSVVVDDLQLLAECSLDGEWEGQVVYIPL